MELWTLDSGFQSLAGFQTTDCWIPDSKAQDSTSYKQKFPYMGQVRARAPHLAIFYNKKKLEVLWIRVPPKIRSNAIVRSPSFTALELTKLSSARAPRMSIRFRTLASVLIAFWLTEPRHTCTTDVGDESTLARENVFSAGMLQFSTDLSATFWLVLLHHKFVRVKCTLSLSGIPLSLSHLVGTPEHPTIK